MRGTRLRTAEDFSEETLEVVTGVSLSGRTGDCNGYMEGLRDHHWESRYTHKVELGKVHSMAVQVVIMMTGLRAHHWESHWDKRVELNYAAMMIFWIEINIKY